VTEDEFDRVFAVNVKSIFLSSRHIIPNFINQGEGGSIINIASIGATRPRPGLVWYNASKAAVANVCHPFFPLEALCHILEEAVGNGINT